MSNTDTGFWKGFRYTGGEQRWMYITDEEWLILQDKSYFNKHTFKVTVHKGYETQEGSTLSNSSVNGKLFWIYYITVCYHIANYFGDVSGRHLRSKTYIVNPFGKIYEQLSAGEVKPHQRYSKELKGIYSDMMEQIVNKGD